MRRKGIALLLGLAWALLLFAPRAALAHGSGLTALVNVSPEVPVPGGTATISIDLRDVYGADVATARVRVALRSGGEGPLATLREEVAGAHKGEVLVPPAGTAVLYVEAEYLDEPYWGEAAIRVGPGGTRLWQLTVDLLHADAYAGVETGGNVQQGAPVAQPNTSATQQGAPVAQPVASVGQPDVPANQLGTPVAQESAPAVQQGTAVGQQGAATTQSTVPPEASTAAPPGAQTPHLLWLGLAPIAGLIAWYLARSRTRHNKST